MLEQQEIEIIKHISPDRQWTQREIESFETIIGKPYQKSPTQQEDTVVL